VDKTLTLFSPRRAKLRYQCHVYIYTFTQSTYHRHRLLHYSSSAEVVTYFFVSYCFQKFSF